MKIRGRGLGRGVLLTMLFVLLVGASLAAVSAAPGESARMADRRLVEYAVDIAIPDSDRVISATFAVPNNVSADLEYPAVLMLHGFGSSKDEVGDMYKREARYLARRGYASLRIDFAAADEGDLQPSLDRMVGDSSIALDWLEASPQSDDDRLGVLGFSFGSRVAALVAGTDDRVKVLASWSGAVANGRTNFEWQFDSPYDAALNLEPCYQCSNYDYAQKYGSVVIDLGWRMVELAAEWFDALDASAAQDVIAGFDGPLLAVAGSEDTTVDPIWSRQMILDAGSLTANLRIIEGADHIYNVFGDQALAKLAMRLTANFFRHNL
ncbi:MAG: alpha/beta hydrolase [bacterium]|nr:alpha/beta hydrolase [bacterium]